MTPRTAAGGTLAAPVRRPWRLALIHTNNSPNPASMRVSGRLGGSMGPPDDQKENPDPVAAEIGVEGIEALPRRVDRYGKGKNRALDVAEYIGGQAEQQPVLRPLADRVRSCGDYLVFRHYFTVDKVRLHGASLCMKHLLCPLCAIRRSSGA